MERTIELLPDRVKPEAAENLGGTVGLPIGIDAPSAYELAEQHIPIPFDYAALDAVTSGQVRAAADEIRAQVRRTAESLLEAGRRLADVRAVLPHGKWARWLRAEFQWTDRTARSFIAAAEAFGEMQLEMISVLPPTGLLRLASAPEEVRAAVIARAVGGERLTVAAIEKAVKDARTPKTPTLPDMADPADLASEMERAMAAPWRRRVRSLAELVLKLAADIIDTAGKVEAKGRANTTKAWAIETYRATRDIFDLLNRLTGMFYDVRPSQFRPRLPVEGRLADILLVVAEVHDACVPTYEGRADGPKVEQMAAWRAALRGVGL